MSKIIILTIITAICIYLVWDIRREKPHKRKEKMVKSRLVINYIILFVIAVCVYVMIGNVVKIRALEQNVTSLHSICVVQMNVIEGIDENIIGILTVLGTHQEVLEHHQKLLDGNRIHITY